MRVVVNAAPPDINEQASGSSLEAWERCDMKDYILELKLSQNSFQLTLLFKIFKRGGCK